MAGLEGEDLGGRFEEPGDEVMVAIAGLLDALDDNVKLVQQSRRRAKQIVRERRRGRSYREIVPIEDEPLIVEMMRENLKRLTAAASELQHAEAKALYAEGLTMEQIGRLFGITHQAQAAISSSLHCAAT